MQKRYFIGTMSGTSADGVDAALVSISGRGLAMSAELRRHAYRPYPPPLREQIFALRGSGQTNLATLGAMAREITRTYAEVVGDVMETASVAADDVAAIAAHGQTLFHAPPTTIQWFDAPLLAWKTNCRVVSDFRRADCAAGGQGAPLVPFADYLLFRHPTIDRVLLNIGGIANLTHLRPGGSIDDVIAFDTGPGNCVSDWLCRTRDPNGPGYDRAGELAGRGKPSLALCSEVLQDHYFGKAPPKSTDVPEMIRVFEAAAARFPDLPVEDLLNTACLLTARTIIDSLVNLLQLGRGQIIVSGGGTENKSIMHWLGQLAGERFSIVPAGELGIPPAAKEAIAFALLAAATIDGVPSNVPSVTGARRAVVLGSITPKP